MIRLEHVTKHYGTDKKDGPALHEVSLQIQKGEIFGIIGKSGAGKSTLLRCMNTLEIPSSGKVFHDDVDLGTLSPRERREHCQTMGMIFQHFNLLRHRTVAENIALPLEIQKYTPRQIEMRIQELLELVQLTDKHHAYPNTLSGGQKQRVAIARALATHPNVLFCDEATSSLDTQTTTLILDLIKDLHNRLGLTVVMITHELNVVKQICDRVAVLDQGRIAELAETVTLFTEPKSQITKDLIAAKRHLPLSIQNRLSDEHQTEAVPLLLLTFLGSTHSQPIIAELIQKFQMPLSILQADIEMIHTQSVGTLLLECPAIPEMLEKIISYLHDVKVHVEILGYVLQPHA